MDSIIAKIVAKEPGAAWDLASLFANADLKVVGKCLTEEEDQVLFCANEFFIRMGFGGSLDSQRRQGKRVLKDNAIDAIEIPVKEAIGQKTINGLPVANPVTEMCKTQRGVSVFLTPSDLLLLLVSARTEKAKCLRKGLAIFLSMARSYVEKEINQSLEEQVREISLLVLFTYAN